MLGRPGVTSLVVGARTEVQLKDNLAAVNVTLSSEETSRLDTASLPRLLYPYWHQAKTAKERLSAADLALLQPYLSE
jgi:diketogulonate reductase-like aldo/keto reductase